MATLDEIGQEKQRISEQLSRLDGERTKLGDQLNELEIAERILTRFGGKAEATEKRRRGRPARTAPAAGGERSSRGRQQAPTVSMGDGILKAVQAHGDGGAFGGKAGSALSMELLGREPMICRSVDIRQAGLPTRPLRS